MALTELAERTRPTIYRHLAKTGTLPPHEALATELCLSQYDYDSALLELAETRNIVLKHGAIEIAHPFATRSFGFSVMGPPTLWWGGCAWDASAIPNLVDDSPKAPVATTCPACAKPHSWTVTKEGPPPGEQLAHFLTPADQIWPDAVHACDNQLIFCSERCTADWLEQTGHELGYVMPLGTLWRLAASWYAGRLDTPYLRREPNAAAEYFREVGLRGRFWGLDNEDHSTPAKTKRIVSAHMPTLNGAIVLVTGANGGIGSEFVTQALTLGARKVYATARHPRIWDDERIIPLVLDVTDPLSIDSAVEAAHDVTVLINNAGANPPTASLLEVSESALRSNMETNFFGPVFLARAFAPLLASGTNATLIDVHSIGSWYGYGGIYSAAKAALWSATNSLRLELAPRGVHVVGVHMSYVDTVMAAHADGPKLAPKDLVAMVFAAVESDEFEVIGDSATAGVKAGLSAPIEALYPELRNQTK